MRLTKRPETYLRTRERHREFVYEALLAAGRDHWRAGERVRCYRGPGGRPLWLPDAMDDGAVDGTIGAGQPARAEGDRRDYDAAHYIQTLVSAYASRLRKAFAPQDWEQLFRLDAQLGLWDLPLDVIEPLWIRCENPSVT